MHTIIRAVLALILAVLLPNVAAQPAGPASAASAADPIITPNTACGAPGVGWRGVVSGGTHRIVARHEPGQRVNARGWWEPCAQAEQRDCEARRAPAWIVNGRMCHPTYGRMIPARNAPFGHDVGADPALRNTGIQSWRCEKDADGKAAWVAVRSWCKPR